jgi:hypothetical protein
MFYESQDLKHYFYNKANMIIKGKKEKIVLTTQDL